MDDALQDLKAAILLDSGSIEQAINEVAADYNLEPHVLRNRAVKAFGDLSTLRDRETTFKAKVEESQEAKELRDWIEAGRRFKARHDFRGYLRDLPEDD